MVKLDVGGTCFHVYRSVLTAQSDNLLNSLFSGHFRIDTQADGSIFIDRYHRCCVVHVPALPFSHRDPEHFPRILAFLRDGVVEDVPQVVYPSLLREANFYSLDNLVSVLQVLMERERWRRSQKDWSERCLCQTVHSMEDGVE